jgi:hypothetical protein
VIITSDIEDDSTGNDTGNTYPFELTVTETDLGHMTEVGFLFYVCEVQYSTHRNERNT